MADSKTQSQQMEALATRLGTELKTVYAQLGKLASLKTTDKTSFVNAVNELADSLSSAKVSLNAFAQRLTTAEGTVSTASADVEAAKKSIASIEGTIATIEANVKALQNATANLVTIDDTKTAADKVFSSSKVAAEIVAAKKAVKDDLLGGAGEAYDTLKELADLITANKNTIDALKDVAAGHVKYDAAQSLTDAQKKQARDNIGAGAAADVTSYGTRLTAVEKKATANTTAITNLKSAVGDTTVDLVAKFEAALAGE